MILLYVEVLYNSYDLIYLFMYLFCVCVCVLLLLCFISSLQIPAGEISPIPHLLFYFLPVLLMLQSACE